MICCGEMAGVKSVLLKLGLKRGKLVSWSRMSQEAIIFLLVLSWSKNELYVFEYPIKTVNMVFGWKECVLFSYGIKT